MSWPNRIYLGSSVCFSHQCVPLPEVEGDITILPPPYVVRMLFIYGRSNGLIEFRNKDVSVQHESVTIEMPCII